MISERGGFSSRGLGFNVTVIVTVSCDHLLRVFFSLHYADAAAAVQLEETTTSSPSLSKGSISPLIRTPSYIYNIAHVTALNEATWPTRIIKNK